MISPHVSKKSRIILPVVWNVKFPIQIPCLPFLGFFGFDSLDSESGVSVEVVVEEGSVVVVEVVGFSWVRSRLSFRFSLRDMPVPVVGAVSPASSVLDFLLLAFCWAFRFFCDATASLLSGTDN